MQLSAEDIWGHLDSLAKPPRSLGKLEELAFRLCLIQRTTAPRTRPRRIVLFAADHGVVSSGVSAWPAQVTALVVQAIRQGTAASTVLAGETGTETVLVNVGVRHDVAPESAAAARPGVVYRDARICAGSRNLAEEPALVPDEFERAMEVGRREADSAAQDGMHVVLAGEMGIGNTTPAACLAMLLAEVPLAQAVGRGAGADEATMHRKRAVVQAAVERSRRQWASDNLAAIAGVSGLEIAAMAGFFAAAHAAGLTVILDGYVASAAALIAEHLRPGTASSMIAAHRSAEPGHGLVLQRLGLVPFLEWNMRLGEGTGALLLVPLLDAAAQVVCGMATLAAAGVARRRTQ
jgi:nicotinate-nucleotide--dimethylbenzimidazole phosphoribosyltransferase